MINNGYFILVLSYTVAFMILITIASLVCKYSEGKYTFKYDLTSKEIVIIFTSFSICFTIIALLMKPNPIHEMLNPLTGFDKVFAYIAFIAFLNIMMFFPGIFLVFFAKTGIIRFDEIRSGFILGGFNLSLAHCLISVGNKPTIYETLLTIAFLCIGFVSVLINAFKILDKTKNSTSDSRDLHYIRDRKITMITTWIILVFSHFLLFTLVYQVQFGELVQINNTPVTLSLFDIIYYIVITSFTVGFGHISPYGYAGKLLAIAITVTGFIIFTIFVSSIIAVSNQEKSKLKKKKTTIHKSNILSSIKQESKL